MLYSAESSPGGIISMFFLHQFPNVFKNGLRMLEMSKKMYLGGNLCFISIYFNLKSN
jgi:hypothetical protein